MQRAIIFANGSMNPPHNFGSAIQSSPLVIAADGGTDNCISMGIEPNVIIGDLDSMQPEEVSAYQAKGIQVIRYPTRKDETDLELALRYASDKNVDEVVILGGLGARWDMTIANILLLAHPKFAHLSIHLLDGTQELILLKAGRPADIHGDPGNTVSLIPLGGDASGIITHGLEYPLTDEKLQFGATRGISNVLTRENAQIAFTEGLLLCIIDRTAKYPSIL